MKPHCQQLSLAANVWLTAKELEVREETTLNLAWTG